ncbi:MAG: hypothetical protein UHS51_06360 [Atopobiaceae bacterium]|nr:hypothetical protein [Atopobiaceae bacterium]
MRSIRCVLSIDGKGHMPSRLPSNQKAIPCAGLRAVADAYLESRLSRGVSHWTAKSDKSTLNRFLASLGDIGIDGNLSTAASVAVVEDTVAGAIDDLDELGELDF